jgi:gluconokinase
VRAVAPAPHADPQRRLWCYRFHPAGYLVGGAVNNGGLLLDWTRRLLYPDAPAGDGFARLFDEAAALPPGADGVRMRPHLVAERDPTVAGRTAAFEGLGVHHHRGALARAAVDALALSLADIVERLEGSGLALQDIAVAGLPADHPTLAGALCACLARALRTVRLPDASAVGAALLGFEALGLPVPQVRFDGRSVTPQPDAVAAYAGLRRGASDPRGRP